MYNMPQIALLCLAISLTTANACSPSFGGQNDTETMNETMVKLVLTDNDHQSTVTVLSSVDQDIINTSIDENVTVADEREPQITDKLLNDSAENQESANKTNTDDETANAIDEDKIINQTQSPENHQTANVYNTSAVLEIIEIANQSVAYTERSQNESAPDKDSMESQTANDIEQIINESNSTASVETNEDEATNGGSNQILNEKEISP